MKALLQNRKKEITEGIFIDLKLINGKVEAFSMNEHIGTVSCEQNPFRIPDRRLKAHVLKNIGEEYELEILTYVDLHRHSSYSLLDSMAKVEQMVEKTEYAGALTDHGVMFGMVEYYETMKKNNKLPIIGFEAYTTDVNGQLNRNHLILLAKNEIGYRNLVKLTSNSYETFFKKPHVTYEELAKHREGIIVLSACIGGEIPKAILSGNYEKAKEIALGFKALFADDFYLEIQRHGIPEEDVVNPKLIQLSKELGIKLVATTDSHYINKEDSYAHEVLCCIRTGRTMQDEKRFKFQGTGYHIHTPEEMEYKYSDLIEALDNTLEIAEKCKDFKMEFGNISMPVVDLPKEFSTVDQYLKTLAFEGFKDRFRNTPHFTDPVYIERLQYELDVISKTGFPGYFIIVWDFIKYARENSIAVGPGRGSAVGCLVAYCLNITDIDPIKYNLLFERFLNTERVSMPDMDIDFEHERRQEVIDYVVRKYGERAVSKIITFGTMGAKMACRDVARALGHETRLGDTVAGLIPNELKMTISKAVESNPKLREAMENDSDIKEIIRVASLLEGCQRHSSVHACGILIAPGEMSNYLPTAIVKDDETGKKELTSQVNMVEAEQLGILKMDFLGLRTMGVLSELSRQTGEDYSKLPINDPYVYAEISKGQTYCVFQLESAGMRKFMTELFADVPQKIIEIENKFNLKGFSNPVGDMTNATTYLDEMSKLGDGLFERAIAGVSLYRPGPMDFIPSYIEGINNADEITYLHPLLQPILKDTFGCIIYQEQVMRIVQDLAGYSLGRADLIRRAMGKKKVEVMEKEKHNFIFGLPGEGVDGCLKRGVSQEVAEEIWDQMVDFAKYAFNKSHAAAYACIAVRCAYFKTYYPLDFMSAALNSVIEKSAKLKEYLNAAKKLRINIGSPDVQTSKAGFSVQGDKIVYGFKGLKQINQSAHVIEEERNTGGPFKTLTDCLTRIVKTGKADKGLFEALVFTGALDCFEGNKAAKLELAQKVLAAETKTSKTITAGQVGLFDFGGESLGIDVSNLKEYVLPEVNEFPVEYLLEKELELAGLYVSGHPALKYDHIFESNSVVKCENAEQGTKSVVMGGLITKLTKRYTKQQKTMYTFEIEDETGNMSVVAFSEISKKIEDALKNNDFVLARGVIQENDYGKQLLLNDIRLIGDFKESKNPDVIVLDAKDSEEISRFIEMTTKYSGDVATGLIHGGKKYKGRTSILYSEDVVQELTNNFGRSIIYKFTI